MNESEAGRQQNIKRRGATGKRHGGLYLAFVGCAALIILAVAPGGLEIYGGEKKVDAKKQTEKQDNVEYNELTPEEERIIVGKGTERAFSGEYDNSFDRGAYVCKRCDAPLFRSDDKFKSGCGWPSFDDAIDGAVKETRDADGRRTEILCANCDAHLGHVFFGEALTDKDVRHCVNSLSMSFIPAVISASSASEASQTEAIEPTETKTGRAYFAGGCFWGVEHLLQEIEGVISVRSGFMGGNVDMPSYEQVVRANTGHAETVEVVFDPSKTNFETLARLFFEIHDPTQVNRQGPDIGDQYRSAVFYVDDEQKRVTENLIGLLRDKGYNVATELTQAGEFWPAEDYHQDYYAKNGKEPYCHVYQKKF